MTDLTDLTDLTDRLESRQRAPASTVVPLWLVRLANWAWRIIVILIMVGLTVWLLDRLRIVVVPVLVALMAAAVLAPMAERLTNRGVPRLLATWIVFSLSLLSLGVVIGGAGWAVTTELTSDSLSWTDVQSDARNWLRDGPLGLSEETIDNSVNRLENALLGGRAAVGTNEARVLVEVVGGLFLAVVLTFFFVKDGCTMWSWIVDRIAPERRTGVHRAGTKAVATLGAYLRAVAVAGTIDAVFIGLGLWIIGVPLVIPLAVLVFFSAFLPIVGATLAGGLAALVALVASGPTDALLVVGLTLLVQQLEGDIVLPWIMGKSVPLHPAAVLGALTAGGALAGVIGAFVSVPVTAVLVAAVGELRQASREEFTRRPDVAAET